MRQLGFSSVAAIAVAALLLCNAGLVYGDGAPPNLGPPQRPPRVPAPANPGQAPYAPANDSQAARFLTMATFGPTPADIALVEKIGYRAWINQQLTMAPSAQRPYVESVDKAVQNPGQNDRMEAWFNSAITAPDQLRQRMAFALSQIMVASDQLSGLTQDPIAIAEYNDMLGRDSTGYTDANLTWHPPTYYNLLVDVTLSPAMAKMLTYLQNQKGNPSTGTSPDENYAREVMQLFSIGLVLLNPDGSAKMDVHGQPIPSYIQATVSAYAQVFTGLSYSSGFYSNPDSAKNWSTAEYAPLICYSTYHETAAKTLLSYSGNYGANSDAKALPANNGCMDDIQQGLAILAYHPNVAPFISRQLIQRFVTSNPTPEYIGRVASIFSASGGDLGQVISSVLLDPEALSGEIPAWRSGYVFGKAREPLLKLTALWRYYGAAAANGLYTFNNPQASYVERPLGASSVFNFYSPDYLPPGELGQNGVFGPEFQILNESTTITSANDLTNRLNAYLGNSGNAASTIAVNLDSLSAVAANADSLVDQVNNDLLYGSMTAATRASILSVINGIPASAPITRAQTALQLVLISPEYAIQK
jgi:uncharacterized protein (DUF1800 family)